MAEKSSKLFLKLINDAKALDTATPITRGSSRGQEANMMTKVLLPKWKTFIRRLRTCIGNEKKRRVTFQYDPVSYALNFDGGIAKEGDSACLDFAARYADPRRRVCSMVNCS